MNITFKQGIIKYPGSGVLQQFLQQNSDKVDLLTDNGSVLINFTQGNSNYIFEEFNSITEAWAGPFNPGSDYWLYWDIDILTAIRTFGHTDIQPLISSTKPSNPTTGQHWFDLISNKMFVFETSIWRNVIRVFASQYDGINFTPVSSGIGNFPYAGTQIGVSNINSVAGKILFNESDKPVLNKAREFYTTESIFNVNGSNIDSLRLESLYSIVKVNETIAEFHVATFISDQLVALADYSDTKSILGMITEDTNINGLSNIIYNGIITNPNWSWTETIGTQLWVSQNGELVSSDPHLTDNISNPIQYQAIGKILSPTSIIFQPVYQNETDLIVDPATETTLGVVKLSAAPLDIAEPIVVTNTDPRLSDDRNPLQHIHDSEDVTFASNSTLISNNVEAALDELNNTKSNIAGTTFTGDVLLNGAPILDLQAANKKYVDDLVNGLKWLESINFINVIGDTILTSPLTPAISDTYIIPNTGTPLLNWSTFTNNDIVQWDGSQWILLDNILNVPSARFGIGFNTNTTAIGTFNNHANDIAIYTNGIWTFETPTLNNAILVNSNNDVHSYHQFVFDTNWIEFAGPHTIHPGKNIFQTNNIFNIKDVIDGGTIDALTLDGKSTSDFVSINGDTLLGTLILNADPVNNLEAATKQYVDNSGFVDLSGDIMTGILTLSGDPINGLEATTKQYVDNLTLGATTLPGLNDVDSLISPVDEDILYYDGVNSLWKSKQPIVGGAGGGGSPYDFITLPSDTIIFPGFNTINIGPTNEYHYHVMTAQTIINIAPPLGTVGKRDRVILFLTNPNNFSFSLLFNGTSILWHEDDRPASSLGQAPSRSETLEIELWENPINSNWFGSYKLYTRFFNADGG